MKPPARRNERGTVLVITLWVLTILAVLALTFAASMHVEARACANQMQRARALYAAKAGVQRAILAIESDPSGYVATTSEWTYLDSEDDGLPFDDERYEVTVTDECGKIDLNSADEELLAKLPQMTSEVIDALLDWRDEDDEARPDGAEQDYYGRLRPPRACANRPFLTLEELLLVNGVTKEAFYGMEATRPLSIPQPETAAQSETELPPLRDVLSVYGGDNDLDAQGQERLNINLVGEEALAERTDGILTEGDLAAILDYRRSMGAFESIGELLRVEGITRDKMQQLADLITTRSKPSETETPEGEQPPELEPEPGPESGIPGLPGGEPGFPIPGLPEGARQGIRQPGQPPSEPPGFPPPMPGEPGEPPEEPPTAGGSAGDIDTTLLPTADEYRSGIYNVNTAPVDVLLAIDGMTEQVVQAIVQSRDEEPFTTRGALLRLTEVTDDLFTQVIEQLTVRSSTLRVSSIGSVMEGRVRVRITVVVDLKESEPRIVHVSQG